MKRGFETKASLTPREKIKVAYAYEIMGISQHDLAALFEVNQGRVAEAIRAIQYAAGVEPKLAAAGSAEAKKRNEEYQEASENDPD